MSDFHNNLLMCITSNNVSNANRVIMKELGKIAIHHRGDFVDLLNNSDAPANAELADAELLNLYFDNIHKKELLIGTAFLVNMHNKTTGFDGESEISDKGVKAAYKVMSNFFGQMDVVGDGRNKEHRLNDWKYNANGEDKSGFIWDTIAKGAVGITGKVLEGQHKKKYGAMDALAAKQKAKADLAQSMVDQRTKQIEAINKEKEQKAKNVKIGLIVGGSIVGLAIIGFLIYKLKK